MKKTRKTGSSSSSKLLRFQKSNRMSMKTTPTETGEKEKKVSKKNIDKYYWLKMIPRTIVSKKHDLIQFYFFKDGGQSCTHLEVWKWL